MTNEEKQALIQRCEQKIKELSKVQFGIMNKDKLDLLIYCQALATLTAQPVLYALRFKNHHGQPDKLINENCLFRSREKALQYGKGGNYVTQPSGKIEWVPDSSLDPEVVPLFTAIYEVQE